MKIAIDDLGYVGLPLALQFARNRVSVLGLDDDPVEVTAINAGCSFIKCVAETMIAESVEGG